MDQHEVFFFARIHGIDVRSEHVEELRSEGIIGHRWLTLAEIRARSGFEVAPRRLADLVELLLDQGPPPEPIDVGM